jgi:hypothetical protein
MWKLCTVLGKQCPTLIIQAITADKGWSVSSVHVCVGDMNDEEGQKMESQLPG